MISQPTDDEQCYYLEGACHVFAMALHRAFGWSFLVVTDPEEIIWTDPEDEDNFIPAVIHVYAVDEVGRAWDILGKRDLDAVIPELRKRHEDVQYFDQDSFANLDCLSMYVDGMGHSDVDRPLHSVREEDVEEALATAIRLYGNELPEVVVNVPKAL